MNFPSFSLSLSRKFQRWPVQKFSSILSSFLSIPVRRQRSTEAHLIHSFTFQPSQNGNYGNDQNRSTSFDVVFYQCERSIRLARAFVEWTPKKQNASYLNNARCSCNGGVRDAMVTINMIKTFLIFYTDELINLKTEERCAKKGAPGKRMVVLERLSWRRAMCRSSDCEEKTCSLR